MESKVKSLKLYGKVSTFGLVHQDLITILKGVQNPSDPVEQGAVSVDHIVFSRDTLVKS
jgi:hypothetical protein